jgi:integrase
VETLVQRDTTKSDAGFRSISLDDEIAEILRTHRERTGTPPDGELAFRHRRGGLIARGGLVRAGMQRAAALVGLPPITPHGLRHSHATWATSENVPAIALAARLGHADASFTLRRYAHATRSDSTRSPTRYSATGAAASQRRT